MKLQLAKFLAYMSQFGISVHVIMLALLFLGVGAAFFAVKDKGVRQATIVVVCILYSPFLFFYIAKPGVLTFMENKMKNSFVDVKFDESAGQKIIQ